MKVTAATPIAKPSAAQEEPSVRGPRRSLPLVAVTGSVGKTTTAWLLTDILEGEKRTVGSWLSSGVYVDGDLRTDEIHAWELAINAARAQEIDVLIQEIPSVLASGLPEGAVGVAVVTSICGSDVACQRDAATEREIAAIQHVIEALRGDGIIIANADDLLIVDAISSFDNEKFLYALNPANPVLERHLGNGGRACWIEDGSIVCDVGGASRTIVGTREIPASMSGRLSYQLQNVLAACAAAIAIGLEPAILRTELRAFSPDPRLQPGSGNIYESGGWKLIVDMPRTLWSLKQLTRSLRAAAPKRVLAVTGSLLHLSESEAEDAGRMIGGLGGVVAIHGENATNHRMNALKRGLVSARVPPITFSFKDESSAIEHVIELLQPGDMAVVLADDGAIATQAVSTALA